MNESIAGFLIDECLSHELAEMAVERGYHALAANRMSRLRSRSDYRVTKYAVDRDLILVTNDMYDLEAIYRRLDIHPGIIFLTADRSKLRKLVYLKKMFDLAIDEVEEEDPVSEAILVTAKDGRSGTVDIDIKRYPLPSWETPAR